MAVVVVVVVHFSLCLLEQGICYLITFISRINVKLVVSLEEFCKNYSIDKCLGLFHDIGLFEYLCLFHDIGLFEYLCLFHDIGLFEYWQHRSRIRGFILVFLLCHLLDGLHSWFLPLISKRAIDCFR